MPTEMYMRNIEKNKIRNEQKLMHMICTDRILCAVCHMPSSHPCALTLFRLKWHARVATIFLHTSPYLHSLSDWNCIWLRERREPIADYGHRQCNERAVLFGSCQICRQSEKCEYTKFIYFFSYVFECAFQFVLFAMHYSLLILLSFAIVFLLLLYVCCSYTAICYMHCRKRRHANLSES